MAELATSIDTRATAASPRLAKAAMARSRTLGRGSSSSKTNSAGERLAVMTALNVTHEFLQFQRAGGFDIPTLKRRIEHINSRLDGALAEQETLS